MAHAATTKPSMAWATMRIFVLLFCLGSTLRWGLQHYDVTESLISNANHMSSRRSQEISLRGGHSHRQPPPQIATTKGLRVLKPRRARTKPRRLDDWISQGSQASQGSQGSQASQDGSQDGYDGAPIDYRLFPLQECEGDWCVQ